MQQDSELQSFLPKSSFDSDTATVAGTSQGHLTTRTKVEYWTTRRNRLINLIKKKETFFVFGPHDTVQQAAEYAAGNYPATAEVPIFNEVFVFFKDGEKEIPISEVNVNVHSMFTAADTMIVSNNPQIFKIQRNQVICGVCAIVLVLLSLIFVPIALLAIFDVK